MLRGNRTTENSKSGQDERNEISHRLNRVFNGANNVYKALIDQVERAEAVASEQALHAVRAEPEPVTDTIHEHPLVDGFAAEQSKIAARELVDDVFQEQNDGQHTA